MTCSTFIIALLVLLGCSQGKAEETSNSPNRKPNLITPDDFVASLKPGMSEKEVEENIRRLHPNEGTWNRSWIPSEGLVRYEINKDAYVVVRFENDRLKKVEVARFDDLLGDVEEGLVEPIRLIHRSTFVGFEYDPTSVIQAVNGLHPLGKKQSLAALRKYDELATKDIHRAWRYGLDEQRIFLIARLLFVRNDGKPEMPWMFIGATDPDVSQTYQDWPLFPLAVVDDVPFSLSHGYFLAGGQESPLKHLKYCEENCVVRNTLLTPKENPLKAAASLISSKRWQRLFPDPAKGAFTARLIRTQAMKSIEHLLNGQHTDYAENLNNYGVGDEKAGLYWQQLLHDFTDRKIRWNAENNQFEEK